MNIIERLAQSVKEHTGLEMYYQSVEELNRMMDGVDFPCAYAFLIESAGVTMENGRVKERITVEVCFTDLSDFDFDALDNENTIERCKQYAARFLLGMQNDDNFALVSVNGSDRVYETRFDNPLTAFCVSVTLEELMGYSECNLPATL